MSEAFRMVRQFGLTTHEPNVYRVETVRLMTESEALQLMRDLGSPYKGQRYPNDPQASAPSTPDLRARLLAELDRYEETGGPVGPGMTLAVTTAWLRGYLALTDSQQEQVSRFGFCGERGPEMVLPQDAQDA